MSVGCVCACVCAHVCVEGGERALTLLNLSRGHMAWLGGLLVAHLVAAGPAPWLSPSAAPLPACVRACRSIQQAVFKVIAEGKYRTKDLGGSATTTEFTKAVVGSLK